MSAKVRVGAYMLNYVKVGVRKNNDNMFCLRKSAATNGYGEECEDMNTSETNCASGETGHMPSTFYVFLLARETE